MLGTSKTETGVVLEVEDYGTIDPSQVVRFKINNHTIILEKLEMSFYTALQDLTDHRLIFQLLQIIC